MVAQTHIVTVVIFVPKVRQDNGMNLVARTLFLDKNGEVDASVFDHKWANELKQFGDRYRWTKDIREEDISEWMFCARDGLYPQFVNSLTEAVTRPKFIGAFKERLQRSMDDDEVNRRLKNLQRDVLDDNRQIWADLTMLNSGSPYSFVDFSLPPDPTITPHGGVE
jgi:hypothetical protein